jgi:hypothetical protein
VRELAVAGSILLVGSCAACCFMVWLSMQWKASRFGIVQESWLKSLGVGAMWHFLTRCMHKSCTNSCVIHCRGSSANLGSLRVVSASGLISYTMMVNALCALNLCPVCAPPLGAVCVVRIGRCVDIRWELAPVH